MSHDDQLDWSSVHIVTREKIIHLRKAGEIPQCRGSSPQALISSRSHPPCHTGLKCWCPFPAETDSVRSVCISLQASLCPGTRWHGEICAQSERYTSDRNSNSRLSILPRESQRTSVCSSSCVCSAPMFSRKKSCLLYSYLPNR